MWRRPTMSDPRLESWVEPEFAWWPYIAMLVCFLVGIVVGLLI